MPKTVQYYLSPGGAYVEITSDSGIALATYSVAQGMSPEVAEVRAALVAEEVARAEGAVYRGEMSG